MAANYTLSAWDRESIVNKGRVIAHHLEKQIREGYENELQEEKRERENPANKPKANSVSALGVAFKHREQMLRARMEADMKKAAP